MRNVKISENAKANAKRVMIKFIHVDISYPMGPLRMFNSLTLTVTFKVNNLKCWYIGIDESWRKNKNFTFIDYCICHRIVSLRTSYSVPLIFIFKVKTILLKNSLENYANTPYVRQIFLDSTRCAVEFLLFKYMNCDRVCLNRRCMFVFNGENTAKVNILAYFEVYVLRSRFTF